jgi:hypothetical protein
MTQYVKCDYCQFDIPSDASICAHCGAQYWTENKNYTGSWGKFFGVIQFAVVVPFMVGIFIALHNFFGYVFKWDEWSYIIPVAISVVPGAVLGFFSGATTSTRRSSPPQ